MSEGVQSRLLQVETGMRGMTAMSCKCCTRLMMRGKGDVDVVRIPDKKKSTEVCPG